MMYQQQDWWSISTDWSMKHFHKVKRHASFCYTSEHTQMSVKFNF